MANNMYRQYYAKRDNQGNLILNKPQSAKKDAPKVKVQGEYIQPRVLTKAQFALLQADTSHPYFYVPMTDAEVEKLRAKKDGKDEEPKTPKKPTRTRKKKAAEETDPDPENEETEDEEEEEDEK